MKLSKMTFGFMYHMFHRTDQYTVCLKKTR